MADLFNDFEEHWDEYVFRDSAHGRPSNDTKTTYFSNITAWLEWCKANGISPLSAKEDDVLKYREILWTKQMKVSTVSLKLTAIRRYYDAAVRREIIMKNPAKDVFAGEDPEADILPTIRYLNENDAQELLDVIPKERTEDNLKAKLIIGLMLCSGLRTVEVHRANVEDLDLNQSMMIVRGKRRSRITRLRADQIEVIKRYLKVRSQPIKSDADGTPLLSANSHRNLHGRISRRQIRVIVDSFLELIDAKQDGFSCHALRHTCATLLLKATGGNIRAVQEQLGHREINQTAKYAHIQEAMLKRYAEAVPLKIKI